MASVIDRRDTVSIPQPAGWPLVGNITDVDPELPIQSLINLGKQYGTSLSHTITSGEMLMKSKAISFPSQSSVKNESL